MTPNNIVNMAVLKNRNIIAVSDHNTVKNCRAVMKAAKLNKLPLIVIPAVEITTSEDIHVLIYFPDIETAETFENEVIDNKRNAIKNKKEIFGEQIIMNEYDEAVGEYENLLINSINLSIDDIEKISEKYNSLAVPAHIDKDSNGILAILGYFPDYIKFPVVEIKNRVEIKSIVDKNNLQDKFVISDSDAHFLWDITENQEENEDDNILYSESKIENSKDFIKLLKFRENQI